MKLLTETRVAIVHEWPVVYAGSEQVVAAMLEVFPGADLFALVHDPEALRGTPLEGVPVRTSFIQSLPKAREKYRTYLPLMPLAVEQFDLRSYDVVLSSNHAVAKGALTRADQLHVSYIHTPIRYAWDLYLDYLTESGMSRGIKSWLARPILHYMRMWDSVAANRVDAYLANSSYVARRVEKLYRRPARVIHPPVDISRYRYDLPRDDFFVAVSRFVPYKRMNLIVEAFTRMGKPLVVVGDGPDFERARRMAGSNVKLLGYQPNEVVTDHCSGLEPSFCRGGGLRHSPRRGPGAGAPRSPTARVGFGKPAAGQSPRLCRGGGLRHSPRRGPGCRVPHDRLRQRWGFGDGRGLARP